jgi:hypothetical protein
MTLGEQFGNLMDSRSALLVERAGFPIAQEIAERMKQLTLNGRSFTAGTGKNSKPHPYDTQYSPAYKKKRNNAGLEFGDVIMRFKNKRIERTTNPVEVFGGAEIGFVEGGHIFKYHHDGTANGNKTRTIFPRDISSVPADIFENFKKLIIGVLSGKS